MAKTYINTVKYEIKLKFEIDGIVDKPDIIGAIFGQSEGLLGDEMDLKELQKNGKVGRIEINHSTSMGRTKGDVIVPSSMDMAETSILAAGIESVDKVGPCAAKFEIADISDTRTNKRDEIKDRAKELLKRMMEKSKPELQSLSEEIRENARAADITDYGPDKLPAGPDIEASAEIIVVEGRADVLNLLRNQIKNVIGMNGSNISETIVRLSKEKEITLFVDGDRGGLLNARKLCQMARVAFISRAPDGKEVEELTRKEILQSLKKKLLPKEALIEETPFHARFERPEQPLEREGIAIERPSFQGFGARQERPEMGFGRPPRPMGRGRFPRPRPMGLHGQMAERGMRPRGPRGMIGHRPERFPRRDFNSMPPQEGGFSQGGRVSFSSQGEDSPMPQQSAMLTPEEETNFRPVLAELKGSMKARILDEKHQLLKEAKVKDIVAEIGKAKGAHSIVLDGVVTKRLIEAAEKAGAKYVIGARKGKIEASEKVKAAAL
ncbi:DNA primase DnaG [uncultured archaeon]|nr:DNA primase DnaG [uncultured archaeon]